MIETPENHQWYLARDGQQHGPLSDLEMRKLVELGYLRETDLIWRAGFPDWRPAPAVFAPPSPAQLPPPSPPSQSQPKAAAAPAARPRPEPEAPRTAAPAPVSNAQPAAIAQPAPVQPTTTAPTQGRSPARSMVPVSQRVSQVADDEVEDPPRRSVGKVLAYAALALLLAGGGFAAYKYRGEIMRLAKQLPSTGTKPAKPGDPLSAEPATKIAMLGALDGDPSVLDAELQKQQVWAVVKGQFPEWYGERLKEVAKLSAEKQPSPAVAKHLVQALVALRRQHADQALSASTSRLKSIAEAFLGNLKRLKAFHTNACYSFISQGEQSPVIIEMLQNQEHSGPLAAQLKAVFEAIAEGRAKPIKHNAPSKEDYDELASQLTKLGWNQNDLQLFADPRALSRTSPERVCKMVEDWFQAHIAIPDQATQNRLLVETLRPVVAG
jgi:hypothetical protein